MGRSTSLPIKLMIALPNDPPVFIIAVPDLGTKPGAAFRAANLPAEYPHPAVGAISSFNLLLHLFMDRRINNGGVIVFHVVLGNLAFVDLLFLCQVIRGVGDNGSRPG